MSSIAIHDVTWQFIGTIAWRALCFISLYSPLIVEFVPRLLSLTFPTLACVISKLLLEVFWLNHETLRCFVRRFQLLVNKKFPGGYPHRRCA